MKEYIARISYGKDSMKMLEVIHSRGLPLDRITTTDVWATDTIPAWLPEMGAFKDRMDDWIWSHYRIQVEHLCARNKDGSKKTYEQMFYHVPIRRSQTVQVERETDRARNGPRIPGLMAPVVSGWTQTECQRYGNRGLSRDSQGQWESIGAKSSNLYQTRIQGFPAQISSWCKKLKIDYVRTPFPMSAPRGAQKEISWNFSVLQRTSPHGLGS